MSVMWKGRDAGPSSFLFIFSAIVSFHCAPGSVFASPLRTTVPRRSLSPVFNRTPSPSLRDYDSVPQNRFSTVLRSKTSPVLLKLVHNARNHAYHDNFTDEDDEKSECYGVERYLIQSFGCFLSRRVPSLVTTVVVTVVAWFDVAESVPGGVQGGRLRHGGMKRICRKFIALC